MAKRKIKGECSKCSKPLEDHRIGKSCYCSSCHAAYMKEHRKMEKENKYIEAYNQAIEDVLNYLTANHFLLNIEAIKSLKK